MRLFSLQLPKPSTSAAADGEVVEEAEVEQVPNDIYDYYDKMDKEDEEAEDLNTVSFEVIQDQIEVLQKRSVNDLSAFVHLLALRYIIFIHWVPMQLL